MEKISKKIIANCFFAAIGFLLFSCAEKKVVAEGASVTDIPTSSLNPERSLRTDATNGIRIGYLWFNPQYISNIVDEVEIINNPTSSNIKEYYKNLTHINLAFINPTNDAGTAIAISESGNMASYKDTKAKKVINLDQTKVASLVASLRNAKSGLRVGISLGGAEASKIGGALYNRYKIILGNSTYRQNFAKTLINYAKNTGCNYIDIDIEWQGLLLTGYNEFVQTCYSLGKQNGINLTLTLEYKYADNGVRTNVNKVTPATYKSCDLLNIMSYDYDGSAVNQPNHTPVNVAKIDIDYFISKVGSANTDKLVLGIPAYGRTQNSGDSQKAINEINFNSLPNNGITSINSTNFYFNSKDMISQKLNYASSKKIGGVMIWSIRHDHFNNYKNSMLKYIVDNQK